MNTNLRQLLMLVKAQADAGFLLHQGLTFSQISALFAQASDANYLIHDDSGFRVTDLGERALNESAKSTNEGAQGRWIATDQSHAIPKIAVEEIYLPRKRDTYLF